MFCSCRVHPSHRSCSSTSRLPSLHSTRGEHGSQPFSLGSAVFPLEIFHSIISDSEPRPLAVNTDVKQRPLFLRPRCGWLDVARKHLYRVIHVFSRLDQLSIALAECPELGVLVHELHFYIFNIPGEQSHTIDSVSAESYGGFKPFTSQVLDHLTQLCILSFDSTPLVSLPEALFPFIRSFGPRVETICRLELRGICFPSLRELVFTFWSFPSVSAIWCIECTHPGMSQLIGQPSSEFLHRFLPRLNDVRVSTP